VRFAPAHFYYSRKPALWKVVENVYGLKQADGLRKTVNEAIESYNPGLTCAAAGNHT
jgi:hypothetical protein